MQIWISEKKDDLIAALKAADESEDVRMRDSSDNIQTPYLTQTNTLSPDELRELATIADEMRHLRKQWVLQASKSVPLQSSMAFVHQGYGTSRK